MIMLYSGDSWIIHSQGLTMDSPFPLNESCLQESLQGIS